MQGVPSRRNSVYKGTWHEAALGSLAGTLSCLVWPGPGVQVGEPEQMWPEAGSPRWTESPVQQELTFILEQPETKAA